MPIVSMACLVVALILLPDFPPDASFWLRDFRVKPEAARADLSSASPPLDSVFRRKMPQPNELRLWYRAPAASWNEAMPIENGRLGAMAFGGIVNERLQLNEDTVWAGEKRDRINPEAAKAIPEVRRLLIAGNAPKAEKIADRDVIPVPRRLPPYQPLGDLTTAFKVRGIRPIRIVLVGDSTVTDGSGWGLGFKQLLAGDVECVNTAANGRSSKSFRDEGLWQKALEAKGDYYLIQFGHNDQPGKGPERETDPETTYRENMARYVDELRAIGAKPILVTSLTRRNFDPNGKIVTTLTPYVEAVKKVAAEKGVPVVDLHARSIELAERLGPSAWPDLSPRNANGSVDTTHLNAQGSLAIARLVVDELRALVPELAPFLRDAER